MLPVLRNQADADSASNGIHGMPKLDGPTANSNAAAISAGSTEQRHEKLTLTVSLQASHTDDLSPTDGERRGPEFSAAAETLYFYDRFVRA